MNLRTPATRGWSRLTLGCALAAAVAVIIVSVVAGIYPYLSLGTNDPGAVVRIGAPLLRLMVDVEATVCTGALVYAAFFTRREPGGTISPTAFNALRTAQRSALGWAVAALVLWPFDIAATVGLPLHDVLDLPDLASATRALPGPKAWLFTTLLAATIAFCSHRTLRWRSTPVLSVVAVVATLPVVIAGHSSSDTGHDIATAAIALHIPAAVIWLGTLVALLRARGLGADRAAALRRYGRLSAACWWVVALSGLLDAAVLAPGSSPFTTAFGAFLLVKAGLLVAVGAVLLAVRRKLRRDTDPSPWRLLGVELAALTTAFAASVALTLLPAPKFLIDKVSGQDTLLGFDLPSPPTALRLLADWRLEAMIAPLAVVLAAAYVLGVRRFPGRWPLGRTLSWLGGCAVLLVASSSGLGKYGMAMFSVQAVDHMLIGMLTPLLLVLGAPFTLAGAVLRPADLPGPAEWLGRWQGSRAARAITQPVVTTLLFIGLPFLLYFTPAYDLTARFHWAHEAMDLVFLAVGFLFAWVTVGVDPAPRPAPSLQRLGLLLVAMPFELVFAGTILATKHIIGNGNVGSNYYEALFLNWLPSLAADQRLGAYLAAGVGEAVMFTMLVVWVLRWRPATPEDDYAELLKTIETARS